MPYTKEQRREYDKEYYENHKEKIVKRKKIYREANKEKEAEQKKKYNEANKEERAKYAREYRKKNKEKVSATSKKWREKNKEERANYHKEYIKTSSGIKSRIIANWKRTGIKSDNYDMLYNNYLSETHCDLCRVKFGKKGDGTGTFKCCDHDHTTGLFRNFLCHLCNIKRG